MLFETELKTTTTTTTICSWSEVTSQRMWGQSRQVEVAWVSTVGSLGLPSAPQSVPEKKKVPAQRGPQLGALRENGDVDSAQVLWEESMGLQVYLTKLGALAILRARVRVPILRMEPPSAG